MSPTNRVTVQVVDADRVGPVADHDADVVPVVDELARDVRAEVAVGADDELRRAHLPSPTGCPIWRIHCSASSGKRAEFLGLLAPLHRRGDEPQRVVDVLLTAPQPVARVGDDRDVRRADDGAVAGVAHRIVELAQHAAGGLVVHLPQRRERRHVAAGEALHRLPDPRRGPVRGRASCPPRARRRATSVGVLVNPWIPVAGLGGRGRPSARTSRMRRPARRGVKVLPVTPRTRTRSTIRLSSGRRSVHAA